jgi:hypothetical protein
MTAIMRLLGVPSEAIRPNEAFPLQRGYSTSTVDEVALLIEEGLIAPGMYRSDSPLAIVLHRRHAARAVALLKKVGFDKRQLRVVSPSAADSPTEAIIRVVYRILILRGTREVPAAVLRDREDRVMSACRHITRLARWCVSTFNSARKLNKTR